MPRWIARQWAVLELPLLTAAVHQRGVLVTVDLADPIGKCGEPVVVVAVENNACIGRDAGIAQQLAPGRLGRNIAPNRIAQLGCPVDADGALNVALAVGRGIYVHLDQSNIGIVEMLGYPLR